ncbi:MAG: alcohol dehydrogenase catalytic domain-containing protein [Desulfovibrionaceae bacterium]|nr:alcohol dehydrogenase catalytic domain-containing protein [Desulfovibrionaceae bacterium]MBF0513482.1 alcohol dehydrogenase catalytic domain-containing protein [Desulfovibrionaceae bacterium]
MRAIYFSQGTAVTVDQPNPEPGPGEALVRVLSAGVCNTDIELFNGYYGFAGVPGHEFVGRIARSPDDPALEGVRVVADINCGCGACRFCLAGNRRHCAARQVIGIKGRPGAFAEYLCVPAANLHPVPDALDDREAVFAEPLAAALEIGQQIHIGSNDTVAVLGDGKLGLLCALGLRPLNPGLLLIGRHEAKLALAAAQGVRTLYCPAGKEDAVLPRLRGFFDLAIEATGRPEGLAQAIELTRPEGTVALKTTSRLPLTLNLAKVVVDEINLIGSRCGDMALALDTLANGRLDVRPLIQAVYPFSEFARAFAAARAPGALKVLLDFGG